jgi:hypothetical protein
MKQWIANLFKETKKREPFALFERSDLRAQVSDLPRGSGHAGHLVEVELFVGPQGNWLPIGVFAGTTLRDAIIVLQEAQEFLGALTGVRQLPTVRLNGGTYFLDGQLSEFRNVDNPHDRMKLVAVM